MRSLNFEYIEKILKENNLDKNEFTEFVETGTYKGATVLANSKFFKNLYTIEICEKAYNFSKKKAMQKKADNINFFLGDSAVEMPKIVNLLKNPTVFFLDGHITDNGSGFTGAGIVDCPLIEELRDIIKHHKEKAVIIVDDTRLLGKGKNDGTANCDWTNVTEDSIKKAVASERLVKLYFTEGAKGHPNDRIVVVLDKL